MLKINPADPYDISHKLHQARKSAGLGNTQIIKILAEKYETKRLFAPEIGA